MLVALCNFFVKKKAFVKKLMPTVRCEEDDCLFVNIATCDCFVINRNKFTNCKFKDSGNQNIYLIEGAYQ